MRESMTALISLEAVRDYFGTEIGAGYATALTEVALRRGTLRSNIVLDYFAEIAAAIPDTRGRRARKFSTAFDVVRIGGRFRDLLDRAVPYWTSADMVHLVDQAANDLPDDWKIYPDDLIANDGMAYLASSLDIAGMKVCAVSWHLIGGHIVLIGYSPRHGTDDEMQQQILHTGIGKTLPVMVPCWMYEHHLSDMVPGLGILKFMAAWWLLIEQPLASKEQAIPAGKELKQDRRLRKDMRVTEVRLRAPKARYGPDHTPTQRDWQSRWLVSGHWRNQPTKSGVTRIYIAPFVKGPADKPLVIRKHVYRWDR